MYLGFATHLRRELTLRWFGDKVPVVVSVAYLVMSSHSTPIKKKEIHTWDSRRVCIASPCPHGSLCGGLVAKCLCT
jgi:hypothetical protein